jgi:hypothetical protein
MDSFPDLRPATYSLATTRFDVDRAAEGDAGDIVDLLSPYGHVDGVAAGAGVDDVEVVRTLIRTSQVETGASGERDGTCRGVWWTVRDRPDGALVAVATTGFDVRRSRVCECKRVGGPDRDPVRVIEPSMYKRKGHTGRRVGDEVLMRSSRSL